jgi:ABC-type multidrug transport system ATPase subunit
MGVGALYDVGYLRLVDHVERLIELFALGPIVDNPLDSYSAGQLKKAMLCSALVAETQVMLLDEPFSGGLDPAGIQALKQVLKRLTKDGRRTVIFSTPVPEILDEVADRMIALRDGTIAGVYDLAELKQSSNRSFAERVQEIVFPEAMESIKNYFDRGNDPERLPSSQS